MGNKASQSWASTLRLNQITPVAPVGNVNSKAGVMLPKASGPQSWCLEQVMDPDVTFCGDECSALFIPQIITFLTHRKVAVSRGRILSTLLRFEAWGCYGASPAQVRRHQKSPKPPLFTLLGWDWPKLGLWELQLGLFAHRAGAELCRKAKKWAGAFAEGWSHPQSSNLCSLLLWSLNCCTEVHWQHSGKIQAWRKGKRSLQVVFTQEKEYDLSEGLSSTNWLFVCWRRWTRVTFFSLAAHAGERWAAELWWHGAAGVLLTPSTHCGCIQPCWMDAEPLCWGKNHCNHLQVQLSFVLLCIFHS